MIRVCCLVFPDVEYKFLEKMRLFMNLLKRCTQGKADSRVIIVHVLYVYSAVLNQVCTRVVIIF